MEEALIEATVGYDILRRQDADPLAVLGVAIAKPELARIERKDKDKAA